MEIVIWSYLLFMNILCFILMGEDKRRARNRKYRIAEKRLFLAAVLGGAPGGTLGRYAFRHKTRHWKFRLGFPALTLLWMLIACGIAYL